MSYDNPNVITYSFGEHDFGSAGEVLSVKGISGKSGVLLDICVSATETFTATTTPAYVKVGTASDDDAYASLSLATTADTDSVTASATSGAIISPKIAADTQVEVTFVAPTGGTPAGKGFVSIAIAWG